MATTCPVIAYETDDVLVLSNYNLTVGSNVIIGCKGFGQRVQGPKNITCETGGVWSNNIHPTCKWTGELATDEKLLIGVFAACGAFLLICLIIILCALFFIIRRRRKRIRRYSDSYPPSSVNMQVRQLYHGDSRYGNNAQEQNWWWNNSKRPNDYFNRQDWWRRTKDSISRKPWWRSSRRSDGVPLDPVRNGSIDLYDKQTSRNARIQVNDPFPWYIGSKEGQGIRLSSATKGNYLRNPEIPTRNYLAEPYLTKGAEPPPPNFHFSRAMNQPREDDRVGAWSYQQFDNLRDKGQGAWDRGREAEEENRVTPYKRDTEHKQPDYILYFGKGHAEYVYDNLTSNNPNSLPKASGNRF